MAQGNYEVRGSWVAGDQSGNRLEVAKTSDDGVLAVRDTFSPTDIIYCTPGQLTAFASAIQSGQMRSLGLHG